MSLQLRPNKHQFADLKRISELGQARLAQVRAQLSSLRTTLARPKTLLAEVAKVVSEEDAEGLVRQLFALQGIVLQGGQSLDDVMAGLRAAVQLSDSGIEIDAWTAVEGEVRSLIEEPCVRLGAKAIELSYDYANLLRRTRILTDIRPLYNESADAIEAAVVSYTLRLKYDTADGEHELSIALDEGDIRTLVAQCERAIAKAKTAQAMLSQRCNLSVAISGDVPDA